MEILEQIKDLETDIQIIECGINIIPFIHKIFDNDTTHYKCKAKINGKQQTISCIIIDCSTKRKNPRIYVPDYFESWIQEYMNSDAIYMVINVALCNVYEKYGHSNALIINKNTRIIERFEPRGSEKNVHYDDLRIENTIKNFIGDYFVGFEYLSPYDFIGNQGPQTKAMLNNELNAELQLDFGRGLCVNYTMLYLYLRLKCLLSPTDTIKFMNDHFININILKFTKFVNSHFL